MVTQRPVPVLQSVVSHYWLSHDEAGPAHPILPDGCTDAVFEIGSATALRVYGVATRRSSCPVSPGCHYLGVCFRPGQAWRVLGVPAFELADASTPMRNLAGLDPEALADDIAAGTVFQRLDGALARRLERRPAPPGPVERALSAMDRHNGNVRIERVAAELGLSRRQLERRFLATVGMAPRTYAGIRRCQWALATLHAEPGRPLAAVAMDAGYADQSHMSRSFLRLLGQSPRSAVAFVQDASFPSDYLARVF